ncbi:MAG: OmpH family outer membrane protein [Synergistaceae bacterium]|jgi:outer membrane protein|nr:OmpH family outer membrane protein [Synergistaceae bacterium]
MSTLKSSLNLNTHLKSDLKLKRNWTKKLFLAVFLCAMPAFFPAKIAAAADTVGVIESQKILYQHPNFERVAHEVGNEARTREAELRASLEKITDPEERRRILEEGALSMKAEEARLMAPINKECLEAVTAVAKKRKITVVLEKDAAYYGGTDITEEVIAQLKAAVK